MDPVAKEPQAAALPIAGCFQGAMSMMPQDFARAIPSYAASALRALQSYPKFWITSMPPDSILGKPVQQHHASGGSAGFDPTLEPLRDDTVTKTCSDWTRGTNNGRARDEPRITERVPPLPRKAKVKKTEKADKAENSGESVNEDSKVEHKGPDVFNPAWCCQSKLL
uniref:Uncharacterized protein n=1 Tax=Melanopsichium pennsylvanicum 4 TaxID=1398559 RepID=A0A077R919_9BASI|nr:uncharacterized protein BN887_06220 [Melanopsichium pennsylvanicum 4]